MRLAGALVWIGLCGCSLDLFGHHGDDEPLWPDAAVFPPPPPPPVDDCGIAAATCEGSVVLLSEYPGTTCDAYDPPIGVYECPGECTSDWMGLCLDTGCAGPEEMCADPPAAPLPPTLGCATTNPTCTTDGTETCGGYDQCGGTVVTGTCTCEGDTRTCDPACADGLCSASAVQAALVGTWTGTAVTPWDTYTLSLTIRPDGHYATVRPGGESAFYYGSDGGGDARRFRVIGQTALGATAVVRIFFGSESVQDGLARGIRIDGDRLRFDFYSAWLDCTRYAQFDLTRQP